MRAVCNGVCGDGLCFPLVFPLFPWKLMPSVDASCLQVEVDAEANDPSRAPISSGAAPAGAPMRTSATMMQHLTTEFHHKRMSVPYHREAPPDGFLASHNDKVLKHAAAQVRLPFAPLQPTRHSTLACYHPHLLSPSPTPSLLIVHTFEPHSHQHPPTLRTA